MRKCVKLLIVLGILAANPAWVQADGLLSGLKTGIPLSKSAQQQVNQRKAQEIATALRQARLNGYDLGVEVRGDTAKIVGKVRDVNHRALAERAARSVPGINRVLNELSYVPQGGIQQTAGRVVDSAVRPATYYESAGTSGNAIEQVHFQKPGKRTPKKRSTSSSYRQQRPTPRFSSQSVQKQPVRKPDHQVEVVQPNPAARKTPQPAPPVLSTVSAPPVAATTTERATVLTPPPIEVYQVPDSEPVEPLKQLTLPEPKEPKNAGPSNQEVAQQIANSMAKIGLVGYDMEIRYDQGTATLSGDVATIQQLQAAGIAASRVDGVSDVDNQLKIQGPVAQTAFGPQVVPTPNFAPQGMSAPVMPVGMSAPAAMAGPSAIAGAGTYSNPNLPSHAWPAYAQYPNSAAIQYPTQYSASAWPYIGPFYPYPQVPLGWREVSLQWDDGHWQLDFEKKHKAWYWLWNPKNWH